MSTFELKCPNCGIDLEADEADIGARVSCPQCEHRFILDTKKNIMGLSSFLEKGFLGKRDECDNANQISSDTIISREHVVSKIEMMRKLKGFYKQGKFLENIEIYSNEPVSHFQCYYTTYEDLDNDQLLGYLSWRTQVRHGQVEKTSLSFFYLYVYELIAQIGVDSSLDGFHKLLSVSVKYAEIDNKIVSNVYTWLVDYVIFYDLGISCYNKISLHCERNDNMQVLLEYQNYSKNEVFNAYKSFSSYDIAHSKFYLKYQKLFIDVFHAVFLFFAKKNNISVNMVNDAIDEHRGKVDSFFELGEKKTIFPLGRISSYCFFASASPCLLVSQEVRKALRHSDGLVNTWVGDAYYFYRNGCIVKLRYWSTYLHGNLLRAIDYLLRNYIGYKSSLRMANDINDNDVAIIKSIICEVAKNSNPDSQELTSSLEQLSPINHYADEIEKVRLVFNQHFMSGIRPGSIIDKNRFRRYYSEDTGSNLREDFPLEATLFKIGMLHEGKVFPLRSSEDAIWRKLVDELLASGHCLLAYSRVMELHARELMVSGITSAEMLHDLIAHEANGDFEINNRYFATAGSSLNLADTIAASIPEDTLLVSEIELCRKHPYMRAEDIHHVLASDLRYVWNCQDIYVVGNRFVFDENEVEGILSEIHRAVSMDGYCSLAQFDFSESMSLNDPEATVNAARRVFGARYLADEYDKHGQIVSRKGEEIDGRVPLREFCRKHPEVTLEQIFAVAADFNITGYLVMAMMHEEMVRVELERFMAPSLVTFDIVSIDQALDSCFANKVMPFGAFHDFSRFPAVPGWSWNPYLLEAFLRRASHDFLLLTPSAASKEVAGVVVRKNDDIVDVLDACAMVVVDAALPADDESVIGDYLQQNGCILRRRASMIAEITARMKMIYEGMK